MKISFPAFAIIVFVVLGFIVLGRYIYFQPRYIQGERIPDFSATLSNGQKFQLSDLRGQYVLLDFWGSWCGPCRAQNGAWVALNQKYSNQGFRIVSIGIEQDSSRWQAAILQDGLTWPTHILDQSKSLRFFSGPLAQQYKVRQLPTTFLLNPQGSIIGVNLEPKEVDRILSKNSTFQK